jgi:hypothetical protein
MGATKPSLDLRPVSDESIKNQTEEAENYFVSEPFPYDAGQKTFVLAYYNDAPGGIGGGTRCVCWFENEKALLEVLANYLLLINPGPISTDYNSISAEICDVAEIYYEGKASAAEIITHINSIAEGCFQIEWIGTRPGLLAGMDDFPRKLRCTWRNKRSKDDSPLREEEIEPFLDYLACDYMC